MDMQGIARLTIRTRFETAPAIRRRQRIVFESDRSGSQQL